MRITRKSPRTGAVHSMELNVTDEQIRAWQDGMNIQRAMPNLTPAEREFFKTGYTQEDWDAIFGKDE